MKLKILRKCEALPIPTVGYQTRPLFLLIVLSLYYQLLCVFDISNHKTIDV